MSSHPTYSYCDYRLHYVYGRTSAEQRREIIDFWKRSNALGDEQASADRARQVVFMVRNADDRLVGVSTVYIADFMHPGQRFYFYRMFIQPEDRVPGMMRFVTLRSRDMLQAEYTPGSPRGIVIVTENRKLMRAGMKRMFERNGWQYVGRGPRGNDLWLWPFKHTDSDSRNDVSPDTG